MMRRRVLGSSAMLVAGLILLIGCMQSFEGDELPAYSIIQQRTWPFEPRSFSCLVSQGEQASGFIPGVLLTTPLESPGFASMRSGWMGVSDL